MFIRGLNGNMINTKYVQGINIRQGVFGAGSPMAFMPNGQFCVEALLTDKRSIVLQEFTNGNNANVNYQSAQAYAAELYNMLNGGAK